MLHLDTSIIIALVVAVPVICLICLYISHNTANKKSEVCCKRNHMGFRTSDTQRSYAQPRSYALLNLHRCSRSCVSAAVQSNYTYNTKS